MNDPSLAYATHPPGSLAWCEAGSEGSVIVRIPPILKRPLGKGVLALTVLGTLGAIALSIAMVIGAIGWNLLLNVLVFGVGTASIVCMAITLWMGFRWTIIDAGPWGLRLQLKGLFSNRTKLWPRHEIADLRKDVSLRVIGVYGNPIGKIDATTPAEERWVMEVLRQALGLPNAGAPATTTQPPSHLPARP